MNFKVGNIVKHKLHQDWEPAPIKRISSSGKSAIVHFPHHYGTYLLKNLELSQ